MGNNEKIIICADCCQGVYCDGESDVIVCCPKCGAILVKLGSAG